MFYIVFRLQLFEMAAALIAILPNRRIQTDPRVLRDRNKALDFIQDDELKNKYRVDRGGIL